MMGWDVVKVVMRVVGRPVHVVVEVLMTVEMEAKRKGCWSCWKS